MSTHSAKPAPRKPDTLPDTPANDDAKTAMDNMYRWTRHVYDLSRKYYLLGRDTLIERLKPAKGENVLEVGCGTARNLIKMARRYPLTNFYGLDASDEMLKTAGASVKSKNLPNIIALKQAFAQDFQPAQLFGLGKPPDKIVFSYALSIIPPWKESIDHALNVLKLGGEIHIVDFGGQEKLPERFRNFLFWWLDKFHVYHKPEILEYLQQLAQSGKGVLIKEHLYKGYAYYAVFRKS